MSTDDSAASSVDRSSLDIAYQILTEMLRRNNGSISSRELKKKLESKGISDSAGILTNLKLTDARNDGVEYPSPIKYFHKGRSFYTEDAFAELQKRTDAVAEQAEIAEDTQGVQTGEDENSQQTGSKPAPEPATISSRRKIRQKEEARIGTYVKSALEDIYASEDGPDCDYVFDVHNDRPGNEYENVDLIATHWRSDDMVEIVAVEIKLKFNVPLVQQASNYCRFADRVWIALPVQSPLVQAATELRTRDPLLFDYVLDQGIGILACHRSSRFKYEVAPIHWPKALVVNRFERATFIDLQKRVFMEAKIIQPDTGKIYPKLR